MTSYFETRLAHHPGRTKTWQAICVRLQRYVDPNGVVLDVGSGRADFINNIRARRRLALDASEDARRFCADNVRFVRASATDMPIGSDSVGACFASNLLEHLDDAGGTRALREMHRVLRRGGRLVLVQPNIYYAFREYWDDYTHKKAFSHVSLPDAVAAAGFRVDEVIARFLPFSFRTSMPTSYWLVRAYLALPWRPLAKQMLVVASKP